MALSSSPDISPICFRLVRLIGRQTNKACQPASLTACLCFTVSLATVLVLLLVLVVARLRGTTNSTAVLSLLLTAMLARSSEWEQKRAVNLEVVRRSFAFFFFFFFFSGTFWLVNGGDFQQWWNAAHRPRNSTTTQLESTRTAREQLYHRLIARFFPSLPTFPLLLFLPFQIILPKRKAKHLLVLISECSLPLQSLLFTCLFFFFLFFLFILLSL